MFNFIKRILNKVGNAIEAPNRRKQRHANAIKNTKAAMEYCLERIRQQKEPHKTGLGYGLIYLDLKHRLKYIESGYLESGLLDDIFDEHGNLRRATDE